MRLILIIITGFFYQFVCQSQSLPAQWHKSEDQHYLKSGDLASDGLYDEKTMEEIKLYFPQSNYWNLLTQNYNSKTEIIARMQYKGQEFDSIGVRFKGQTSYFMNNTQKKSFSISMDYVKDGQKVGGSKTLNLNNSWQDPSFMREVLYYNLIRNHTPAAKANFVRLYINDMDWGVYENVQQLNKDFLQEWYSSNDGINIRADVPDGSSTGPGVPGGMGSMWGDGTAGLNYLGSDTARYQKYYTLKSSGHRDPWTQLMSACDILNNTPIASLENVAPKYFDIDKILWHLACEIAFGDDDSYVYKGKMDYYLYQDEETGRWTTYDYDANSTLLTAHVSWSPFYNETKVNYPLLNKFLAVSAFRQRYLAHMRTIISELFDESKVNGLIDQYDALIKSAVFADTKKGTTNSAYTSGLNVLKNFIKDRKTFLLNNSEVKVGSPKISQTSYFTSEGEWGVVTPESSVSVRSKISFAAGIQKVQLHYGQNVSASFTSLPMYDDGTNGDDTSGDGIYSVTMPAFPAGTLVKYYIEAVGNDAAKSRSYYPEGAEHHVMIFEVEATSAIAKTVVVNEFMASNTGIIKDENDETEDWIELYNTTGEDINLSGYNLTDNSENLTKFTFGDNSILKANDYLIIWADEDQTQGPFHANFKLAAGGESIFLLDKNLVILDEVIFGQQTANKSSARKPNGTGDFVIGDHTFDATNDGTSKTDDFNADAIKIYPNPSSEMIWIENNTQVDIPVSIYDMNGRKRYQILSKYAASAPISNLEPGVYVVKFGEHYKKLLIAKK